MKQYWGSIISIVKKGTDVSDVIRRLRQRFDQIQMLNENADVDSKSLQYWRKNTLKILTDVYGPNSSEVADFKAIYFVSPKSHYKDSRMRVYKNGLKDATQYIKFILSELELLDPTPVKTPPTDMDQRSARVREDLSESTVAVQTKHKSNRIFIVHGHDEEMKQHVARTLSQLKLDPVILHEEPSRGRTIIEKFEEEAADVGFAVVLLSPDDEGRKVGNDDFNPRARQNVVLELGFFYGTLGRGNVVALHNTKAGFEVPSDVSGVIYVPYDRQGAWKMKLCNELQESGYRITADDLL